MHVLKNQRLECECCGGKTSVLDNGKTSKLLQVACKFSRRTLPKAPDPTPCVKATLQDLFTRAAGSQEEAPCLR